MTERSEVRALVGLLIKKGIITQAEWAVALFEGGGVSLSDAAKVAGMCLEDFLDALRAAGVPAVNYPAEELDDEMKTTV